MNPLEVHDMTHRTTRYTMVAHATDAPSTDSAAGAAFSRIGKRIKPQADGCWIYNDKPDEYSCAGVNGQLVRLHRWVYEVLRGPIPDGYHLHHLCFTRGCVNPDHLEPLTPGDHIRVHRSN